MPDRLAAYIAGTRIGWFVSGRSGSVALEYDDAWRMQARRAELSLSLPKSRARHDGPEVVNYLWNLLPDNEGVLERWGTTFAVNPRNPMALLGEVGLDTAGAVQLSVVDEPALTGPSGLAPIDDETIGAHIRRLRSDPDAWLLPGDPHGYFSLAGAQSKFALATHDGGWAIPMGRAPSTHIFKPGIRGLDHGDLNEHLSMDAAARLGLEVARTRVLSFDGEHAIVIERYDRVRTDGSLVRRHQEDLAQAAGIHPATKYQNDGGPAIADIARLIRAGHGRDSEASVRRFFDAVLFNWVILGTDGHAKNYSLLHDRRNGPRLAPLYDLTSALPYDDIHPRKATMAVSIGGHYPAFEISPRHIAREAQVLGIDPEDAIARAREIVAGIADAYSEAAAHASLSGADSVFAATLTDRSAERADTLLRELDQYVVTPTSQRRSSSTGRFIRH